MTPVILTLTDSRIAFKVKKISQKGVIYGKERLYLRFQLSRSSQGYRSSGSRSRRPLPAKKLVIATDATWPPMEYVDESTKEIVGFDIDFMKAVADAGGFRC